jgi:hypothetical protein
MMVDWLDVLTKLAGIAGLGVALYTLYMQRRATQPRVRVTFSRALPTWDMENWHLLMSVANAGLMAITIEDVGLQLPDGRQMIVPGLPGTTRLPAHLQVGQTASFWVREADVVEELASNVGAGRFMLRTFARDGFGEWHLSNQFPVNVPG